MLDNNSTKRFENIVKQLFELMRFEVEVIHFGRDWGVDLIVADGITKHYIETKFYRSVNISSATLKSLANSLAYYLKEKTDGSGLLIVNSNVPQILKQEILNDYGVYVWDRETIYSHLSQISIELRDEFETLLISTEQGTDTYKMLFGKDIQNALSSLSVQPKAKPIFKRVPEKKGQIHWSELSAIKCGKDGWSQYENKCLEILKFLFADDLTLWEKQSRTDDNLSRFDLICRISSKDDYWRALVNSFNTRFVLFEFKNYCDPIGQGQIYTTERYLYNKALRSVGFILAKEGGSLNAISAAKGALKEHGKLVLIISNTDLQNMLEMKDRDESPSDYLSNLLDNWLISLSR